MAVESSAAAADRQFVLTRVFDAPRERVWQMWTDPIHFAKWFGPRIFTNPVCELDVRPGGKFRVVMRGPAGDDYPFTGTYLEVEPPSRLVYKNDGAELSEEWLRKFYPDWDGVSPIPQPVAEVTFEDLGGKTRQTIRITYSSKAALDGHVNAGMYEGWSDSLDAFAELVADATEMLPIQVTRRFSVPAERVYDAWLDKEQARKWFFKTAGGELKHFEMDARVGGGFVEIERRGDMDAEHYGKYIALERPRRIVFDFATVKDFSNATRVEINIVPVPGGCEVELKHAIPVAFAEYADRTRTGWATIIANLSRALGMSGGYFPGDEA